MTVTRLPVRRTPTPELTRQMQPSECSKHRMQIAAAVKGLLANYWTPDETAQTEAMHLKLWIKALEDWPLDQIEAQMMAWVLDNPNRRPNFGHIVSMLKTERGRLFLSQTDAKPLPIEPPQERVSPERASAIMLEVFGPLTEAQKRQAAQALSDVAAETGYPVEVLRGRERCHDVCAARHKVWQRLADKGWTPTRIARAFPHDTSTISQAIAKRKAWKK